jgi:hypothetical protein
MLLTWSIRGLRAGAAALITAAWLAAPPALGAETPSSPTDGTDWHFVITPYLWGVGLDGDTRIGRLPSAGVEASFSELLDVLDLGLMATFEGRRGRWGFLVDGFYVKLSETVDASNPTFGSVDVEFVQEIYSGAAFYRVLEGKTSIDVLFGPRYTSLRPEMTLVGGVAAGRQRSGKTDWWDGVAGTRVLYHPTAAWSILGYLDVGAGSDDLSWQGAVGAGYDFKKVVGLRFGYRYLHYDYDDGNFVYDMAMAGPYLGASFRW